MIDRETVHQNLGPVGDRFASPANGERGFSLLLAAQEEAWAALARAQEAEAIDAGDVSTQADEALVLG